MLGKGWQLSALELFHVLTGKTESKSLMWLKKQCFGGNVEGKVYLEYTRWLVWQIFDDKNLKSQIKTRKLD